MGERAGLPLHPAGEGGGGGHPATRGDMGEGGKSAGPAILVCVCVCTLTTQRWFPTSGSHRPCLHAREPHTCPLSSVVKGGPRGTHFWEDSFCDWYEAASAFNQAALCMVPAVAQLCGLSLYQLW